eukprot:5637460-Amphidinium_carterae.1
MGPFAIYLRPFMIYHETAYDLPPKPAYDPPCVSPQTAYDLPRLPALTRTAYHLPQTAYDLPTERL